MYIYGHQFTDPIHGIESGGGGGGGGGLKSLFITWQIKPLFMESIFY